MEVVSVEEFTRVVDYWINQDWPILEERLEGLFHGLGWLRNEKGSFQTNYRIGMTHVSLVISKPDEGIDSVGFRLTEVIIDATTERDMFMNDWFTRYVKAATELWGPAVVSRSKEEHVARWDTPVGCRIEVANRWHGISVKITSPMFCRVLRQVSE